MLGVVRFVVEDGQRSGWAPNPVSSGQSTAEASGGPDAGGHHQSSGPNALRPGHSKTKIIAQDDRFLATLLVGSPQDGLGWGACSRPAVAISSRGPERGRGSVGARWREAPDRIRGGTPSSCSC